MSVSILAYFGSKKARYRFVWREISFCKHGAYVSQLCCIILHAICLRCREALASFTGRHKWPQKFEEATSMCPADFGTGCLSTPPVPLFFGKLLRATTLLAMQILLLLWWTCSNWLDMVDGSGHALLFMERYSRRFQCQMLLVIHYDVFWHCQTVVVRTLDRCGLRICNASFYARQICPPQHTVGDCQDFQGLHGSHACDRTGCWQRFLPLLDWLYGGLPDWL